MHEAGSEECLAPENHVQGPLAGPWLRRALPRAAGQALDAAVLNGEGSSGQPLGILGMLISNQSGTSYARVAALAMKKNATDVNAPDEAITFITTTAVQQLLEGRPNEAGGGSYIWQDGKIVGCPAHACTLMPSATMLSGPFEMLTVGL